MFCLCYTGQKIGRLVAVSFSVLGLVLYGTSFHSLAEVKERYWLYVTKVFAPACPILKAVDKMIFECNTFVFEKGKRPLATPFQHCIRLRMIALLKSSVM